MWCYFFGTMGSIKGRSLSRANSKVFVFIFWPASIHPKLIAIAWQVIDIGNAGVHVLDRKPHILARTCPVVSVKVPGKTNDRPSRLPVQAI